MILKYACKEFKKYAWMNLAVILQMAVMLLIIISMVSTVLSRFTYFTPYEDYISHKGVVGYFMSMRPRTSEKIKERLTDCSELQLTYIFDGTGSDYKVIVYDDPLLERYAPTLQQGELFIADDSTTYAQGIAPISSGYQVGDIVNVAGEGQPANEIRISGVFDDAQKVLSYNPMATQYTTDHRLYYAEAYEEGSRQSDDWIQIYLSRTQCAKLSGDLFPNNIGFAVFEDDISIEAFIKNQQQLGAVGLGSSFKTEDIYRNGRAYVFEQVYSLMPAIIGIFILLIMSMFSVNGVSTVRQLRSYAVYRTCGLTWKQCGWIGVCRATLVTLASVGLCGVVFLLKNLLPFGDRIILELGWVQALIAFAVVLSNLLISIAITTGIIRHSQPNALLKEN